ncbi:MAG: isoprenylcysteine carboxylmethyltransferase family protein [Candidatus Heimdallarchaeota archaeon]|nr:isoprenylcysteine carboxylmethyltransferase family protein [Candidatus Heimdallarchaeota archaeon]
MKQLFFKSLGLPLFILYVNLGFLVLERELTNRIWVLIPILLLNVILSADIVIRPISRQKDRFNRLILAGSFLMVPVGVVIPFLEFVLFWEGVFPIPLSMSVLIIGGVLELVGGIFLIGSRIQLGKYGGPKIVLEEDHRLVTGGFYRFIRHPMYTGFLLFFFGYSISFSSILMTGLITLVLFILFKIRMDIEEEILLQKFNDDYRAYIKRTQRLFRFIY